MNVYRRHTSLLQILDDGWHCSLQKEQVLRHASAAGYARCIAEPALIQHWDHLDQEFADYLDNLMFGGQA